MIGAVFLEQQQRIEIFMFHFDITAGKPNLCYDSTHTHAAIPLWNVGGKKKVGPNRAKYQMALGQLLSLSGWSKIEVYFVSPADLRLHVI